MSRVQYLFRSRNIIPDTIKYIVREDKRSVIYFMDDQKISTSISMKEIMTMLPEKDFVSIQKGVIVAVKQIVDISNSGVYTMTDGKIINDGSRTAVIGFAFPGLSEDLGISPDKLTIPDYVEISADCVNFSMGDNRANPWRNWV